MNSAQKNKITFVIALALLIGIGALMQVSQKTMVTPEMTVTENDPVFDYRNATYSIDGRSIKLSNGVSEITDPQSTTIITTRYFGNELTKDINGDGQDDVVFLVTQDTGGSGTFYYVVGALYTDSGYVGTPGILLGDRIAPQTTESGPDSQVIVNYADRAPGEAFTTTPSIGKSLRLLFDTESNQFGEVVTDFEGEADPTRMTLDMKTWNLVGGTDTEGNAITWNDTTKFSITFMESNFSATTDCNSAGGTYTVNGNSLSFGPMMSTLMYCDGSQETQFISVLSAVTQHKFTSRGELILLSASGIPSLTFR